MLSRFFTATRLPSAGLRTLTSKAESAAVATIKITIR